MSRALHMLAPLVIVTIVMCSNLHASPSAAPQDLPSITDTSFDWPTLSEVIRALTLRDYNTRLVVLSTAVLGLATGLIGSFMLLRKRSLMGDALSHATLPGIALAFILMASLGGTGKSLPALLIGAAVFGLLGVGCVLVIRETTRLKDDAALGIVLSVFFGLGVALLGIAQDLPHGSAAGLESCIYGKTASMVQSDLVWIVVVAVIVAAACGLLYKEFTLLCFDDDYAAAQGWPTHTLDVLMMALVTLVTVVGLQAVGLILIIALLIIPPAAARFWTERMDRLLIGAALIGLVSGWFGATLSALTPRMPAGAIIVVVAASVFLISMIFGAERGVLVRYLEHWRLNRKVNQQHLLRAIFETLESSDDAVDTFTLTELVPMRSWSRRRLQRLLRWARRRDFVDSSGDDTFRLTDLGRSEATRVTRNHRLWEMYLITHADIAPSHVDRDADLIEHVLGADMVARLERALRKQRLEIDTPLSPHALAMAPEGEASS